MYPDRAWVEAERAKNRQKLGLAGLGGLAVVDDDVIRCWPSKVFEAERLAYESRRRGDMGACCCGPSGVRGLGEVALPSWAAALVLGGLFWLWWRNR